jgi:hypothetical protein
VGIPQKSFYYIYFILMKKIILIIFILFMVLMLLWSAVNRTRWAGGGAAAAAQSVALDYSHANNFGFASLFAPQNLEAFTGKAGSGYMIPQSFTPYNNNDNGTLYNIYDTIYFDKANGNLVIDAGTNVQIYNRINVAAATYTSYQARDGSNNLITRQTTESQIKMPSGATVSWTCKSGTYQVTYIPFNNDTYIHLMDISAEASVIFLSAYFTDPASGGGTQDYYLWTSSDSSSAVGRSLGVTSGAYKGASATGDGANAKEVFYDTTAAVYQISQDVKYDLANGNLLVENVDASGNKTITVYPRASVATATYTVANNAGTTGSGKTPSSSVTTLMNNVKKPIFAADQKQTNFVIYWPVMNNTIIALYKATIDGASGALGLVSVTKAVGNALYVGGSSAPAAAAAPPASAVAAGSASVALPPGVDAMMANYFKWFSEFNQSAGNDKYILKSAIVPPVCPAAPSCNCGGSTSCASCKNGAGAAAATTGGATGSSGSNVDSNGNIISDSIRGTGNLASDTIRGTGQLASDAVRGTASFAKSGIQETAGAVKGGVEYIGKGVGGFLSNLTKGSPTQVSGGAYGSSGATSSTGTGGAGTYRSDVYSYGGSINSQYDKETSRPEPRAVIADFSKFGR